MTTHLDDADILALLDAPAGDGPAAAVADHLAECAECRSRMDRFRSWSDGLARWFDADDAVPLPAPPTVGSLRGTAAPRPRFHTRWAAAAAIVLVLGLSALGPLRAWVTDLRRPPESAEPSSDLDPSRGTELGFEVVSKAFEIRVTGGGPTTTLVVVVDRTARGTIVVSGGNGSSGIFLREDGLDLTPGADGGREVEYRITLPAHLERVDVLLSGALQDPHWTPGADEVPRVWRIPLFSEVER